MRLDEEYAGETYTFPQRRLTLEHEDRVKNTLRQDGVTVQLLKSNYKNFSGMMIFTMTSNPRHHKTELDEPCATMVVPKIRCNKSKDRRAACLCSAQWTWMGMGKSTCGLPTVSFLKCKASVWRLVCILLPGSDLRVRWFYRILQFLSISFS